VGNLIVINDEGDGDDHIDDDIDYQCDAAAADDDENG